MRAEAADVGFAAMYGLGSAAWQFARNAGSRLGVLARAGIICGVAAGCGRNAAEPVHEAGAQRPVPIARERVPNAQQRGGSPVAVPSAEPLSGSSARASAAPLASSPLAAARSVGRLDVPASQRFEPGSLQSGERRPLLVFLHGLGTSGSFAFQDLKLQELGARERVFVVAPDGAVDARGRKFWNAHPACCDFDGQGPDDVARLRNLIDEYRGRGEVDPARVYVAGFSNGGFMAHRLGCEIPDRIAAIASISGAGPDAGTACKTPNGVAALEVHGDADPIVRFEGGRLFGLPGLRAHASALETLSRWGQLSGCSGAPQEGSESDLDSDIAGEETVALTFQRCDAPAPVLWRVRGGNHYIGRGEGYRDRIWAFLAAHRK